MKEIGQRLVSKYPTRFRLHETKWDKFPDGTDNIEGFFLTHSLTHSLTDSLTHSFTHSFIHSLTHSLTHLLTHSLVL